MLPYILGPVVAAIIAFIGYRSKLPLWWLAGAVALIVGLTGISVAKRAHNDDVELIGARVVKKDMDRSPCVHTYSCNCTKVGKVTHCSTCRRHTTDYDYSVHFSSAAPETESCGDCSAPGWWTRANVGDAVAVPHHYQNYLKADPNNILIPARPADVQGTPIGRARLTATQDRFYADPIISDNVPVPVGLSNALRDWNADFGGRKQAYINLGLTTNPDPQYADLLAHEWGFGPKNALVFIVSVDGDTVRWARLVSFSAATSLHRWTRDELAGKPVTELVNLIGAQVLVDYERTPMATVSYLEKMTPVTLASTFMILLAQLFAAFLTVALGAHAKSIR